MIRHCIDGLRLVLALAFIASCVPPHAHLRAARVCGELSPESISKFHESHVLSNGANVSSVEALAAQNWQVCIENGVAEIQNHPTENDQ